MYPRRAISRLTSFTQRLVQQQDPAILRKFAVIILVVQALLCIAALWTKIILHGDGSFFVFAVSVGLPWELKWSDIPARLAVYLLTAYPSYLAGQAWSLSALTITAINSLLFYAIPFFQFALAMSLMWRRHPQYLLFPIAQFCLTAVFGFGFPSEILLAPGFLWICCALLLRDRGDGVWFYVSLTALLLCHELALPAAVVIAWIAIRQRTRTSKHSIPIGSLIGIFAAFGVFLSIRLLGGGAGSDENAIYVFDPRRNFNHPSLILSVAITALALGWLHFFGPAKPRAWHYVGPVVFALAVPLLLSLGPFDFNFGQGRYDSARAAIGLGMFLLALGFAASIGPDKQPDDKRKPFPVVFLLCVMLAAGVSCASLFAYHWRIALHALEKIVEPSGSGAAPIYMSYDDARNLMSPREAILNDQMGFLWVLPFRSAILADGGIPRRIVYDIHSGWGHLCSKRFSSLRQPVSAMPAQLTLSLSEFSCNHKPPPRSPVLRERFMAWLRAFLSRH